MDRDLADGESTSARGAFNSVLESAAREAKVFRGANRPSSVGVKAHALNPAAFRFGQSEANVWSERSKYPIRHVTNRVGSL